MCTDWYLMFFVSTISVAGGYAACLLMVKWKSKMHNDGSRVYKLTPGPRE